MKTIIAGLVLLADAVQVFAQEKPAGGGGFLGSMLPMMLVMFAIIYFFMIRPEQKKQKSRQGMLESLKKGCKVVTSGGVHGTIANVKDNTVMVRVGDNMTIEFNKSAIASVIDGKEESKELKAN